MQSIKLNTIRQLLPDSNKCCQITYSKHFLSYQIYHIKQHLVLSIITKWFDLILIKPLKPRALLCEGCRYHEKAGKSRRLVVVGSQAELFGKRKKTVQRYQ